MAQAAAHTSSLPKIESTPFKSKAVLESHAAVIDLVAKLGSINSHIKEANAAISEDNLPEAELALDKAFDEFKKAEAIISSHDTFAHDIRVFSKEMNQFYLSLLKGQLALQALLPALKNYQSAMNKLMQNHFDYLCDDAAVTSKAVQILSDYIEAIYNFEWACMEGSGSAATNAISDADIEALITLVKEQHAVRLETLHEYSGHPFRQLIRDLNLIKEKLDAGISAFKTKSQPPGSPPVARRLSTLFAEMRLTPKAAPVPAP